MSNLLVDHFGSNRKKTYILKVNIFKTPWMINSFNSTMCSHVVTLSDGLCQLLQKKRKNIVFAVLLLKKKTLWSSCTLTDAGSDYLTLGSLTLAASTSQIPGPRTVVRAAFRCLFVTDGCAHTHRRHCSKRLGCPGPVNQSRRGVEMRFYPATDLEHSPLLRWTQVGWRNNCRPKWNLLWTVLLCWMLWH